MIFNRRNIIFISICLGLAGLFYFYYTYIYKEPVHWEESYEEERKDPYGTFILFQLLNGLSANEGVKKLDNPVSQFLKRQTGTGHANYVFVGDMPIYDSTDAKSLFEFAEKGNDVLIAANSFPDELNRKLFEPALEEIYNYEQDTTKTAVNESFLPDSIANGSTEDTISLEINVDSTETIEEGIAEEPNNEEVSNEYVQEVDTIESHPDTTPVQPALYFPVCVISEDSILHFRFTPPNASSKLFRFQYINDFKPQNYPWRYFNDTIPVLSSISKKILSDVGKRKPVFYQFKVGKGHIYYHSLPLTFTNLYLKQRSALEYANTVFSNLQPGVVYWDNFHKTYHESNNSGGLSSTPLKYILSQPSLAWAWYLTLAGVVVYMIFYGKRKQKVIPLLEQNTNTSIEFVETLSLMYLKSSFAKIAEVKAKNLRIFIWERYKISSDLPLDEYTEKVSVFSGIEKPKIMLIFVLLKNLQYDYASKEEFLEYHGLIEYFHKNCK